MSEEIAVVRPLTSEEVKDAIAQTIAEKVRESLNSTCWLYGRSWAKFKFEWRVDVTMSMSPGDKEYPEDEKATHVAGTSLTHELREGETDPVVVASPVVGGEALAFNGSEPYTPPDVVRKRHGMPIPTIVKRDDGSTEQKAVVFKKTGRMRDRRDDD